MSLTCIRTGRGCKPTPRRHLPDCEHAGDGECRGCQPRLAEFGALCLPDHYGLVRALHDLPHARTLLAGHLEPSYARRTDMVKVTKGNPPVPLNLDVLDVIREYDHIPMAWARIHAEEHDLTAPADGAAHLRIHLASVECSEWIADAWDELTALVSHAHALVPWRAEARKMGAPCPHCHCQALVTYGGDDHVTCQECGGVIGPQEYAMWVAAVLEDRRQETAA